MSGDRAVAGDEVDMTLHDENELAPHGVVPVIGRAGRDMREHGCCAVGEIASACVSTGGPSMKFSPLSVRFARTDTRSPCSSVYRRIYS